ncbi:MAG TPA: SIS domain-containing protein [Steroidobacteraceae bacterium]
MLGLTAAQIQAGGAYWTAREITQQPLLWPEVERRVTADEQLAGFLAPLLADAGLRVVLTGAGTSSFIGECLAPALARSGAARAAAIASTDIVSCPESSLAPRTPTLMVHFARSGNSPESVAALELGEDRVQRCAHLIVTCNAEGNLYRRAGTMRNAYALLLPEASNDQSFAMTSSFTSMLLAAAGALRLMPTDGTRSARLSRLAMHVLTSWLPLITSLVHAQFERVVYLGSNELKGLAREAALKMLELTDGRVVSLADAPLGFRHGPKTILNGNTLVVVFLSNDAHTRRYDLDLLAELRRDHVAGRVIALSSQADDSHPDTVALSDSPGTDQGPAALSDLELCLPYVVFAQTLATLRSLSLGVSPDKPNSTGTVNRVVQGVRIYPHGATR